LLSLVTLADRGERAYVVYRYGSYPAARVALLKYIEFAESHDPEVLGPSGRAFDLMLAYGRLGVAAERAGEHQDAQRYLRQAAAIRRPDGHVLTEAEVRSAVDRVDRAWERRLGVTQAGGSPVPENNEMQRTKPAQAMELRR
jgi:hypothetical protein